MSSDPEGREAVFDAIFASEADPWAFESSAYEREKRSATMAALDRRQFGSAFEVGCANGLLTRELTPRCKSLLAVDVSSKALDRARVRLSGCDHVEFIKGNVPHDWPVRTFDLIVLSEVLYFLSAEEVALTSKKARKSLGPEGTCLLVNWTGPTDLPLDGHDVVNLFEASADWRSTFRLEAPNYRIDRFGM